MAVPAIRDCSRPLRRTSHRQVCRRRPAAGIHCRVYFTQSWPIASVGTASNGDASQRCASARIICVTACATLQGKEAGVVASRHLSLRLERATFERLEAESRRLGQTRSEVAKTLLAEGLRIQDHPGITFRSGPAGRRAGVVGGPDVWEVMRVVKGLQGSSVDLVTSTREVTGLSEEQVRIALRYYAEYPDEIEAWIQRVDEEAAKAEDAWLLEQALLTG